MSYKIDILPELSISASVSPGLNSFSGLMCALMVLKVANYPIYFSLKPHGKCSNCCAANENEDISYIYYNKSVRKGIKINYGQQYALRKLKINPKLPTVFYVHGWTESAFGTTSRIVRNAYLNLSEDYNVFVVDWPLHANALYYQVAVNNTKIVAENLARFLLANLRTGEFDIAKMHLIGFSLGAHIVGFAGKTLKANGYTLPWITGIDVANPMFQDADCSQRLCNTDADFVDVMHNDGGNLGLARNVGHADFYMNPGIYSTQPGCSRLPSLNGRSLLREFTKGILPCSHLVGPMYYAWWLQNSRNFFVVPKKQYKSSYGTPNFLNITRERLYGQYNVFTNKNRERKVWETMFSQND